MANKRIDQPTGTETVGHEWDGIEELNTPLPRWWLWTFYATIAWALVYVVLYPAWPLIDKATDGTLGWSSRGDLAREMSAAEAARQGSVRQPSTPRTKAGTAGPAGSCRPEPSGVRSVRGSRCSTASGSTPTRRIRASVCA